MEPLPFVLPNPRFLFSIEDLLFPLACWDSRLPVLLDF